MIRRSAVHCSRKILLKQRAKARFLVDLVSSRRHVFAALPRNFPQIMPDADSFIG
jgi:hypothetical protein